MIDRNLRDWADARDGLFTRRDALHLGVDDSTLAGYLKEGACRRVCHGVFTTRPRADQRDDRLRERTLAMLRTNPQIVASHASAALLHGLPLWDVNWTQAQGMWLNKNPTRSTPELRVRRSRHSDITVVDVEGHQCVPPALATCQVACDHGVVAGLVVADAALHRDLMSAHELAAAAAWLDRARGSSYARRVVELADRRSESPGESRARLVLRGIGLEVVPQVEVFDGTRFVARVDFLIDGTKVVIEFDGASKYAGPDGHQALLDEKAREDDLRRLGYVVVRLVWADLDQLAVVRAKVLRAAAAVGQRWDVEAA